jgi:hypothetical protein
MRAGQLLSPRRYPMPSAAVGSHAGEGRSPRRAIRGLALGKTCSVEASMAPCPWVRAHWGHDSRCTRSCKRNGERLTARSPSPRPPSGIGPDHPARLVANRTCPARPTAEPWVRPDQSDQSDQSDHRRTALLSGYPAARSSATTPSLSHCLRLGQDNRP